LTNAAPNAATHQVLADITELGAGNGYAAGGAALAGQSWSQAAGLGKLVVDDPTFTGSGGSIGPFRYAVLYNSTPGSPLKPLIGYWDYGVGIMIPDGGICTIDLDQANGTITLTTPA
jgi:hypothetical protein